MASASPNAIVARFQRRITDLLRDFDELLLAVHDKQRQASLETMIAEQSVMLIAVLWEAFINDLLISYVMRDSRPCFASFEQRFRQSVADKFAGAAKWISLDFPPGLSRSQVEKLLDPKGWNLAAQSAQDLSELANRHLSAVHAIKFSLAVDDRDFVDYLVSLRNFLSHRSTGARQKFTESVRALKIGGPNDRLRAPVRNVGVYLKQRLPGGGTRVNIIGQSSMQIATRLL